MFESVVKKVEANKSPPRVDKRITASKSSILDAAISLYQEQGIDRTSTSQVIERAKIGRTTFYRHFSDRDDLLNQALTRDFDALMTDFKTSSRHYDTLEVQIEEDMLWFLEQFDRRPALGLLFSDIEWQQYQQTFHSVEAFRKASIACATPTYRRALQEGRLRPGITMDNYIDWASFVVISLQSVRAPSDKNRIRSRQTLRNFLVPSLINDQR